MDHHAFPLQLSCAVRKYVVLPFLLAACGAPSSPTPATPDPEPGTGADPAIAAVVLPGDCVDPAADAAGRLAGVGLEGDVPFESSSLDLDGDGTLDKVYVAGASVIEGGAVYVMRGTCGHFVGDVHGSAEKTGPDRHHGLADLSVPEVSSCEGARCGCEPGVHWYRFDGDSYVLDEAASTDSVEHPCADD
jgi:hypothetical protein